MARRVIAEFDAIDGPFINKLRQIDASVNRFEAGTLSAFGRVEKGLNGLLASAARLQNVSGIIAGGFGVQMAANYVDQAVRIRRALTEAGDSSQEAFEKAFLAAQRSLSGFEAFTQGIARMRKATGGTFEDSVRNMETLNKLLVLGGKTTQERMSTMIQFSQALQAGVLQGEELRSLRENAPIELVRAIAREAGGTIADLKDFGAEGKLTTEVMIRALKSLEAEADIRMRNVTLTISEAATQLSNAGIVASEAFDKGLGLSRATVAVLTGLAEILGSNAEAFELFGQAAKIAFAVGVTSFAGRAMNNAVANTRAYGAALRQAAVDTKAVEIAAQQAVATTGARVQAIRAELAAMVAAGASKAKVERAYARLEDAQAKSAAASRQYMLAADAATLANDRLAFSARATAAAGRALRGAFDFLGGWPGLILTAGLAFATMSANAESAAEKFERLTTDTGTATNAADALLNVQQLLTEAMDAYAKASDEASRKVVANTMQELAAKRTLLELEQGALLKAQEERRAEIERLKAERAAIPGMDERQAGIEGDLLGAFPRESAAWQEAFQERMLMAQQEYNAELQVATDKIREMEAAYVLAGGQIDRNNALLGSTALTIAEATLESFGLADALAAAFGSASGIASTNMAGAIDPAASAAQRLVGYLASAWNWVRSLVGLAPTGPAAPAAAPSFEDRGRMGSATGPIAPPPMPTLDELIERNTVGAGGGGGGGGGRSETDKAREEALRFIESMMTAEERHAQQVKELADMRGELVARYGEEADIVRQLDEATRRLGETGENAYAKMLNKVSQMVLEGKKLDEIISSILVQFLEMNGTQAFTALFSGGGFGSFFSTLFQPTAAAATTGGVKLGAGASAAAQKGLSLPSASRMSGASAAQKGGGLTVHVHENAVSGAPQVKHDPATGRVDVFLRKQITGLGDSGGLDQMMERRYGLKPKAR